MHRKGKVRVFGRARDQRKAFMKSLIRALVLKKRITTTEARAKELRPAVEKLITRAKSGTLAERRKILSVTSPDIASVLIEKIAPGYKERKGGYTRIIKMGTRKSDSAQMAIIELV